VILYEDAVLAAYNQNFATRRSAGRRGARVVGHKATVEFNWNGETMRIIDHHANRVDQSEVHGDASGHGGGDNALMKSFIDLIRGEGPSVADLGAGLQSVAMCLAARDSFHAKSFRDIPAMKEYPAVRGTPRLVER
jgi:hypothetical protein